MRISIHLGLHKTGSTSVQASLRESRQDITHSGVLFPKMPPESEVPGQHYDLAHALGRGDFEKFRNGLESFRDHAERSGLDTVLLSSERFSTLPKAALEAMDELCCETFDAADYFCVLRNLRELVRSGLKQRLVHNAISLRDRSQLVRVVEQFCLRTTTLTDALGDRLTFVSFSECSRAPEGFCNAIVSRGTGINNLHLTEAHQNTSTSLYDMPYLHMTAIVREALSIVLDVNPYSQQVNETLYRTIDRKAIEAAFTSPAAKAEVGDAIKRAITAAAERAIALNEEKCRRKYPHLLDTELFADR